MLCLLLLERINNQVHLQQQQQQQPKHLGLHLQPALVLAALQVLECPTVCPKRRSLQSCVEECTGRMDERQQLTYTQFFGDVLK